MVYNVKLTPNEYMFAAQAGFMRQATSICRNYTNAYGYSGIGYDIHILGSIGEYVVAKHLGLFWSGIGFVGAKDVGVNVQVRTTTGSNNRLILHPKDADDDYFVLVTGDGVNYTIRGYIQGVDAKRREWWQAPQKERFAYFVPQSALLDVNELRGMVMPEMELN